MNALHGNHTLLLSHSPETGQSLYEDPNSIEHVQAPTGDVYALPDKNSKRRPPPTQPVAEIPTYQDPNTIKREQAPTGDIYTLPEKKPVYSKVNKNKQVSIYSIQWSGICCYHK